jgi:hypothetical protein
MAHPLTPVRVTFDTNVFERVLRLDQHRGHAQAHAFEGIHRALERGAISGFICESAILLDGIRRKDRAAALSSPRLETTGPAQTRVLPDGTIENRIEWKLLSDIPALDPEWIKTLDLASQLGFQRLASNRRDTRLDGEIPGPPRAREEDAEAARRRRDLVGGIQRAMEGWRPEGKAEADVTAADVIGIAKAKLVARKFDGRGRHPGVPPEHWPMRPWYKSLEYALKGKERDEVADAVGDWADADSLAAHIGYGLDYFCTMDQGKSVKGRSILDAEHRAWLAREYGVKIVSPVELLSLVPQ